MCAGGFGMCSVPSNFGACPLTAMLYPLICFRAESDVERVQGEWAIGVLYAGGAWTFGLPVL